MPFRSILRVSTPELQHQARPVLGSRLFIPTSSDFSQLYPRVHSSAVHNSKTQKQHQRPSADEWIQKGWYLYTEEHDSTVEKKEIMPFAATWIDLEIVTVSEVNTMCCHSTRKPENRYS